MIHAYNKFFLPVIQTKMGEMFEISHYKENKDLDDFAGCFVASSFSTDFAEANPISVFGLSSLELVSELTGHILDNYAPFSEQSPEYWVGSVWAYLQWYCHIPYASLLEKVQPSLLLPMYYPFHEMDIRHVLAALSDRLQNENKLKALRQARHISQSDLAILSGVPLRSIKAYEQGTVEISSAQAETLFSLAQTLGCHIDDLVLS